MPGFARLHAGVVRIGRHLAKRRNIMWRLQFDLSREQNSPDQPGKRVQNGRSATPLIVISRFELPLLGSNQDSPDPEPSRAGLFGGHHVRKWLPAKHRRPQAKKVMPGLARRNACKTLARARYSAIPRDLLTKNLRYPFGESAPSTAERQRT